MAYRIGISIEAAADLQAIYDFIAVDSPDNASKMVGRILSSIDLLKKFPLRHVIEHQSRKLKYPVRSLPVKPYVIFFRVVDDDRYVRVLTIRHGARRRPRHFN
jgi:toxin ParE1/3/4